MRRLLPIPLAMWLIAALILLGARQIARLHPIAAPLPLPDSDGCWDGLCLFHVRQDDLPAALAGHSRILTVGQQAAPNAYHVTLRADDGPARGAVIQAAPDSVLISWDWSERGNPPLLTLGDVLRVYGPPDRLDLHRQAGSVLWYANRSASVVIQPIQYGIAWLRLAPDDPVTRLTAIRPDRYAETAILPAEMEIASGPWRGFGTLSTRP